MENQMHSFTVQNFFEGLVAELVVQNKQKLQYEDPELNNALRSLIARLFEHAREQYNQGDRSIAHELLEILDTISPNPNTGAFDGLWSELRDLQPRVAFTLNPQHPALQFKQSQSSAEETIRTIPQPWRKIVSESAQYLVAL